MASHNKLTFTAEYCRCIRVKHRIKREALLILTDGIYWQVCYSLYNLTYENIIQMINEHCDYYGIERF